MPPCRPTRSLGVKIGAKPRDRDVPPIRRVSTGEADAAQVERERVAAVVASRHGPAAAPSWNGSQCELGTSPTSASNDADCSAKCSARSCWCSPARELLLLSLIHI